MGIRLLTPKAAVEKQLPIAKMAANNVSFGWVHSPCSLVFSTTAVAKKIWQKLCLLTKVIK